MHRSRDTGLGSYRFGNGLREFEGDWPAMGY